MPAEEGEMTSSAMIVSNSGSGEASTVSSSSHQAAATASETLPPPIVTKKKRNLPGMPDPDAEVISLSPRTLMATNRFVCEICNKGFQRDQNLQLHRRSHNLPWKLRQRNSKEVKKRVYVCPETSCVHHDPSRALGDLTGIKKHFCRKHGDKMWKCDKCSKKYAVQSDLKAHCKTCGTREYRCDCGTLFSRRDSFITHRAFCDALVEESAEEVVVVQSNLVVANSGTSDEDPMVEIPSPPRQALPPISPPPAVLPVSRLPVIEQQQQQQKELESANATSVLHHIPPLQPPISLANDSSSSTSNMATASSACTTTHTSLFASLFSSAAPSPTSTFSDLIGALSDSNRGGFAPQPPLEPISLCLSAAVPVNIFSSSTGPHEWRTSYGPPPPPSPHMSATALLQKAAWMGAAATNTSLLRGFGLSSSNSSSTSSLNNHLYPCKDERNDGNFEWRNDSTHFDLQESHGLSSGLGLALQYGNGGGGLPEFSSLCGAKPPTLDFLGLGMGPAASGAGLSAMMTSIGGSRFEMGGPFGSGSGKSTWDRNGMERKPSSPARL